MVQVHGDDQYQVNSLCLVTSLMVRAFQLNLMFAKYSMDFDKLDIVQQQLDQQLPAPGKTGLDWFLYCYFADQCKNAPMLEIGAGNGGSLYTLLSFTDDLTCIDSWSFNWSKSVVVDNLSLINRSVTFVDKLSTTIHPDELKVYGFVHLDANKDFDNALLDLTLASKVCNGIICVDDYMNSMWPEVSWAVDEFVKTDPTWKKICIGNHQIFLARTAKYVKKLVVEFPVIVRNDIVYFTYGKMPTAVNAFILGGKMQYLSLIHI